MATSTPLQPDVTTRPADGDNRPADLRRHLSDDARTAAEREDVRRRRARRPRMVVANTPDGRLEIQPASTEEIAVQVSSVFGFAMVGALLFHLAWWLLTGG